MHRAAVHAYDKACDANEPDELKQRGLVSEIDTIFRRTELTVRLSNDQHASGREGAAKFLDHRLGE